MAVEHEINGMTTVELAAAIGQGRMRAIEAVTACLDRVAERNEQIKAWVAVDVEGAIAQARAIDESIRSGHSVGALAGVPIGIKDIIDTADLPTEHGSPAFAGRQPRHDAVAVERLRSAGAIVLGKTVTTELATLTPNVTRNPRNLEHTPGGSSSGSAAAVADGMVPAALGTQTGGSVIRPASFCGVYAFKPSAGIIPRVGVLNQSETLDTIGVYGRSVEDLALLADVTGGFDGRDPACFRHMSGSFLRTMLEQRSTSLRLALVKTAAWADAESQLREAFGELIDELGSLVQEVDLDATINRGLRAHRTINNFEIGKNFGPILDRRPEAISPRLTGQIAEGRAISQRAYEAALIESEEIRIEISPVFKGFDAILTPAALGPAPKGLGSTGDPVFNAFWTLMGAPAVNLPMLQTLDGMPMGVQLVGAPREDGKLLQVARLFEHLFADPA